MRVPRQIDTMLGRTLGLVRETVERAYAMDAVARAVALASQAFTAGIPFIIVLSAVLPHGDSFADRLIHRFKLKGETAAQLHTLFLPHAEVRGAVTWISVAFLVVSMLSLAGSLQIVYERTFVLPHIGLRARWRAATWLIGAGIYIGWFVELRPNVYDGPVDVGRALLSVLGSLLFWAWTPRILLGRRLALRRLLPVALVTSVGVLILTLVSPLYMPSMVHDNAARFGTIGVVFALLSWLVALAFIVVGSAVVTSQIDQTAGGPAGSPVTQPQGSPRA
jgi:membrane protein